MSVGYKLVLLISDNTAGFFNVPTLAFPTFFAVNLFTRLALTAFLLLYVFGDIDKCIEIIDPSFNFFEFILDL